MSASRRSAGRSRASATALGRWELPGSLAVTDCRDSSGERQKRRKTLACLGRGPCSRAWAPPTNQLPAEARTHRRCPGHPATSLPPSPEKQETQEPPTLDTKPPCLKARPFCTSPQSALRPGGAWRTGPRPGAADTRKNRPFLTGTYTGLSFLLQMFSCREGHVALRGSQ